MITRVLSATAILVLLAGVLAGCDGDSSELQRVVCEVQMVNVGVPLLSAYLVDGGDGVYDGADDSYPADAVMVSFRARPYSSSVTTISDDDAYSSYIITGYNLTWVPAANAPAGLDLSPYNLTNVPFYLQVPVGDDAMGTIMVADRAVKEAIGGVLGMPWGFGQDFSAVAHLQFIGHDSGSSHESVIEAGLYVNFTYALTAE